MLWRRHLSLYSNTNKAEIESKKEYNKKSGLAPLSAYEKVQTLYGASTIEAVPSSNLNPTKFTIRKKSKSHKISTQEPQKMANNTFFLHKGNNHMLVKQILQSIGLVETLNKEVAAVIWYQGKDIHRRDLQRKQLHPKFNNYLPNHSQITNKQKLYENLVRYQPQCVNQFIPKSYIIDFKESLVNVEQSLVVFMSDFFRKNNITSTKNINIKRNNHSFCITNYHGEICILYSRVFRSIAENRKQQSINQTVPKDGENLWIVKPAFMNRGQGIQVIKNLKQLQKFLSEDSQQISIKLYQSQQNKGPSSYIIQQYIQNPLLYKGYKFDMRIWIMLRKTKKNGPQVYIYKKGYVRLAARKYTLAEQQKDEEPQVVHQLSKVDELQKSIESPSKMLTNLNNGNNKKKSTQSHNKSASLNDRYIHLTNNAVQKNCKEYGTLHQGNQLSISQMVKNIGKKELTQQFLFEEFIKIIQIMIQATQQKLFGKTNYGNFMLIGMDFLVDINLKVWLIEANCNPCMEQSSGMLKQWLPSMLESLVRIVKIDKLAQKNQKKQEDEENRAEINKDQLFQWQKII